MNAGHVAAVCRALIVSLLFLSYQSTAGMIGTDQVAAAPVQADRIHIQSILSRAEITHQLEALGVDVNMAQERVASMTDGEARALSDSLRSVPAGAGGGWAVALVVLAVFAWWWWYRNLR